MEQRRRVDLSWVAGEVEEYEGLVKLAKKKGVTVQEYIKAKLREVLSR
jgi:hypothetical protein